MLEAIPEYPDLTVLEKNHRDLLRQQFHAVQPDISEMSFAYLWSWKPYTDVALARHGDVLIVVFINARTGETVALPPVTVDSGKALHATKTVLEGNVGAFVRVPDILAEEIAAEGEFVSEEERERADYVYEAHELGNLPGQRYHSKKNHIRQFVSSCPDAVYRTMDRKLAGACADFAREWLEQHPRGDMPGLRREVDVTIRMLDNFQWLELIGGVVLDKGRTVAFALGEKLNDNTFVVRVEKADADVPGSYQFINREFVRNAAGSCRWINREQDLGIPGLRRAKQSYLPHHLVRKYRIVQA